MISTISESLLACIKPAIRKRSPYLVGGDTPAPEVKLNQNESPFDVSDALKQELIEAFLNIPFNRYPAEHPYRLRQTLSEQLNVDPEGILIGNGSNELTYTLGLCLISEGTPVVLPSPMFSLYEKVVRLHEGTVISVPPLPNFDFDVTALQAAVHRHKPALTVVTTPNNPTGRIIPFEAIDSLLEATPGFLLIDEAYVEFTSERSALDLMASRPNLLILRTFSKAMGLAGLRIGYMLGHPDVIREFMKSRLPFVVDPLAETVALTLLQKPEIIADRVSLLLKERDRLFLALKKLPNVEVIPSEANFLLFKTTLKPAFLMKKLASLGVLVRNMGGYSELAGYLRVNAGSPDENKAFLNALEKTLYA